MDLDRMDRLVLNPNDLARLRATLVDDITRAYAPPVDTIFGVPVSSSDAVPEGQVLKVRQQPVEPIAFGLDLGTQPDYSVWLRYGFSMLAQPRFLVVDIGADGWSPRRLTKAQQRRKAKQFIREEVARRRMAKARP